MNANYPPGTSRIVTALVDTRRRTDPAFLEWAAAEYEACYADREWVHEGYIADTDDPIVSYGRSLASISDYAQAAKIAAETIKTGAYWW